MAEGLFGVKILSGFTQNFIVLGLKRLLCRTLVGLKRGFFWRRLFPRNPYDFAAILILTLRSFLSMASSMHSWIISSSFSSLFLASVRPLISSARSDAIADGDEGTFAVSEDGSVA